MTTQTRVVLFVGAAFVIGFLAELPYLNGPWYWRWPWRDLSLLGVVVMLLIPAAPYAFVLYRSNRPSASISRREAASLVAILVTCNLLFQLGGMLSEPQPLERLRAIVESPWTTSYYTDALAIQDVRGWLARFHDADLHLHSSTHPPGPILYYRLWIWLFGPDGGAYVGAALIGLWGSLGVPVLYRFSSLWTQDRASRLVVCALYVILPGLVLFFPEFDQGYPVLSMAMILFWAKALAGKATYAVYLGGVLFVATFFAYNLLAVGAPMALWAVVCLAQKDWARPWAVRTALAAGLALGVAALVHMLVALATGYQPVASFGHAFGTQSRLAAELSRPYWPGVFFDLYDFVLGGGIMTFPLAALFLRHALRDPERRSSAAAWTAVGLLSILIVDASGLLRTETSRVWLFLQPLIVVPAGLELARIPFRERASILAMLWITVCVLKSKLAFITA